MASVTSLDKDLRKMRLDKYTPAAANEARQWIEGVLGAALAPGDLLKALKDGVALCKLVNLAIPPPGVKCKNSAMPFVQMENVSHFLRACQSPPLNLQEHDMFLTVDLYESKDPAQVLQCLQAFSRAANKVNPSVFPTAIGGRGATGISPQRTGHASPTLTPAFRGRGLSNASSNSSIYGTRPPLVASKTGDSTSGRWSPAKSPTSQNGLKSPSVSTWSSKNQEGVTAPAWNIAQYGYMGGASQGNLGVSFGGRRQITSAGPAVPSKFEKEKRRKEEEARQRQQMEEEQVRRKAELEAEEERARLEEERKWEEEMQRLREVEKRKVEEEKRRWEEEERQWKITEEKRRRDEEEAERRLAEERSQSQTNGDSRLRGQFLSQYKAENGVEKSGSYGDRIKELEKELELARQREADYERERQERSPKKSADAKARARSRSRPRTATRAPSRQDSWARDEREVLQTAYDLNQQTDRPSSRPGLPPRTASRPLPDPATAAAPPLAKVKAHRTGESLPKVRSHNTGGRPLPDPTAYAKTPSPIATRSERPLPVQRQPPPPTYSRELGATAERDAEDRRRMQSTQRTKAGHVASKSLLEREMELERQRQREWEEAQKETAKLPPSRDGVDGIGGGIGGRWDVNQWSGYTGGDTQNKGAQGIGAGRRQIVGPRPLPGTSGGR